MCNNADANTEIEVTSQMIEAGADVILGETGGADLGGAFSAPNLAEQVFRAMSKRLGDAATCRQHGALASHT